MSTTSLKPPEDVKQLAAEAARQRGISPHAFMVEAIRGAAIAAEMRAAFVSDAVTARTETHQSGTGYAAADVHEYIQECARGKNAPEPKAKPWRS